jgi:acyl dehydratase
MGYGVGDRLPVPAIPAVDRMRIAYMAVSMRDPNPVHVEDEYAVACGLPGVIAHGTFVTAYLGLTVSRAVGVAAVRRLRVDLTAPVAPGDRLSTEAVVVAVRPAGEAADAGSELVTVELTATRADGVPVGRGTATFVQPNGAGA